MRAAVVATWATEIRRRVSRCDGTPARSPRRRSRAACRIVQEAVTNVRLHAAAKTLTVTIECERDLRADGRRRRIGFDPDRLQESAGMGLDHMRERARALGGVLEIESATGAGTEVTLRAAWRRRRGRGAHPRRRPHGGAGRRAAGQPPRVRRRPSSADAGRVCAPGRVGRGGARDRRGGSQRRCARATAPPAARRSVARRPPAASARPSG